MPGNILSVLYSSEDTDTHPRLMTDAHLAGEILALAAIGERPERLKELQTESKARFQPAKYHQRKP